MENKEEWIPREDGSFPALDGLTTSEAMYLLLTTFPDDHDLDLFRDDDDVDLDWDEDLRNTFSIKETEDD